MTGIEPDHLARRWADVRDGAGQGIDWVNTVRHTSPSVAAEADGTVENLRRARNLAKRLGEASLKPMSAGFFGLSQAGKSYLISALKAGEDGKLETILDGTRLDFIDHINPLGGGKEATGLVTRFTHKVPDAPRGHPITLRLFTESDLVKLLSNAFLNDFDREKVEHDLSPNRIRAVLERLEPKAQSSVVEGLDEDDLVDIWDYFKLRYSRTAAALKADYWPTAVWLAPRLLPRDRAELFAVIWGEVPEITEAYLACRATLEQLSFAQTVFAPTSALVTETAPGEYVPSDSIMNVDMIARLDTPLDGDIEVRPLVGNAAGSVVKVSRARLTILTTELIFELAEPAQARGIDNVDLLDFPGYRGRLGLMSKDDAGKPGGPGEDPMIAQLLLRGKVAYLFERYTDNQEMNVMVVCTPADRQSDVSEVGPVLNDWIEKTQGQTAADRANRKPGLIWTITKFDLRIANSLPQNDANLALAWGEGGLMKQTLLEKFGGYAWLQEWTPGRPFDNTFLVRKPRMPAPFLTLNEGEEKEISPEHDTKLKEMRRSFCADPVVARHIQQPAEAWDAMMQLNDGGMARLAAYLAGVTAIDVKLQRIAEQLEETVDRLTSSTLGRFFFEGGAGETEKKKEIAKIVTTALRARGPVVGELLSMLEPRPDQLRGVYLRAEDETASFVLRDSEGEANEDVEQTPDVDPYAIDGDFFAFSDAEPTSAAAPENEAPVPSSSRLSPERRFAQAAVRDWIKTLREVPEDARLVRFFGIKKEDLSALCDELITAALRLDLEDRLCTATERAERQAGTRAERLVDRQALVAQRIIGDFVAELGFADMPVDDRPNSEVPGAQGRKLFAPPPPIPKGQLPSLSPAPLNYTGAYLLDWMTAFRTVCHENAGHSLGRDISAEQNDRLGTIVASVRG